MKLFADFGCEMCGVTSCLSFGLKVANINFANVANNGKQPRCKSISFVFSRTIVHTGAGTYRQGLVRTEQPLSPKAAGPVANPSGRVVLTLQLQVPLRKFLPRAREPSHVRGLQAPAQPLEPKHQ